MEKAGIGDSIAIIGLFAGIMSGLWGAIKWYGKLRELIYANRRDIEHASRNAQQAKLELVDIAKSIDEMQLELRQLQTIISMLLAERGQTSSEILGHRKGMR